MSGSICNIIMNHTFLKECFDSILYLTSLNACIFQILLTLNNKQPRTEFKRGDVSPPTFGQEYKITVVPPNIM